MGDLEFSKFYPIVTRGYFLICFIVRVGKEQSSNEIQLDFFTPSEANEELIRLANQAGYDGNVALYLANNGLPLKRQPDPKKSLKKLEKTIRKKGGDLGWIRGHE